MSACPERPVLDAIDELVDWQIEEGRKRGDDVSEDDVEDGEMSAAEFEDFADAFMRMAKVFPQLTEGLAEAVRGLAATAETLPTLRASIGSHNRGGSTP